MQFNTAISNQLTLDLGEDVLISSQAVSPAKVILTPAKGRAKRMKDISGQNIEEQLKKYSQGMSLMKMLPAQFLTGSWIQRSATWRLSATPGGRPLLSLRLPLGPFTDVTGSGFLPTPSGTSNHGKNHVMGRLDEWGGSSNPWRGTMIGKICSPTFEEWMMGYPIGFTVLMG